MLRWCTETIIFYDDAVGEMRGRREPRYVPLLCPRDARTVSCRRLRVSRPMLDPPAAKWEEPVNGNYSYTCLGRVLFFSFFLLKAIPILFDFIFLDKFVRKFQGVIITGWDIDSQPPALQSKLPELSEPIYRRYCRLSFEDSVATR